MLDAVIREPRPLTEGLRALAEPPAWLRDAADPKCIAAAFEQAVPEFADGELVLRECEAERLRLKEDACIARYRLAVSDVGSEAMREVVLTGELIPPGNPQAEAVADVPFGSPDWSCSLPELRARLATAPALDPVLPVLPALTSPRRARALIERAVREANPEFEGFRVQGCQPQVVRYKPGSRCTVVCDLDLPDDAPDEWPDTVVAKTYRGGKGETAFAGMRALWDTPLRASGTVTIAQPLGFLREENVLLQRGIPHECTLKQLLRSALAANASDSMDRLEGALERTARGLAELHRSGASAAETFTWEEEAAEVRSVGNRLAAIEPELGDAVTPLLARLERAAAEHPAQPAGPAHRSFRPAQVVIDGDRVGFIDFDGFCLAEPAIDVALFRTTLLDIGLQALHRRGGNGDGPSVSADDFALLDRLGECFLTSYEDAAPLSRPRVALWESLYLLTGVLHCWTKVKFERLAYRLPLLRRQMHAGDLVV